ILVIHAIHDTVLIGIVLDKHVEFPTFSRLQVETSSGLNVYTESLQESNSKTTGLAIEIPVKRNTSEFLVAGIAIEKDSPLNGIVGGWPLFRSFCGSLSNTFNSDPIPARRDDFTTEQVAVAKTNNRHSEVSLLDE